MSEQMASKGPQLQETDLINFSQGRILVVGVGGGGGNAVNHMVQQNLQGADLCVVNTDQQALDKLDVPYKYAIGSYTTRGLGAGANPEVGYNAAKESAHEIEKLVQDYDIVFITAGMGGGTGTGAAHLIAQEARKKNIVTIGVVTLPFTFEGKKRDHLARQGIEQLRQQVNSLIIIPNDKLKFSLGPKTSLLDAFGAANDVLYNAMSAMVGIIHRPGFINVDFADVKTVMSASGLALIGNGESKGQDRVEKAVEKALSCELITDIPLENAQGLLVCVTSSQDISLGEFQAVGEAFYDIAGDESAVIIGTTIDESMGDSIRITVVATGFETADAL